MQLTVPENRYLQKLGQSDPIFEFIQCMLNHLVLQYKCILPQQCLSPKDRFTVSIILFTGLEDEKHNRRSCCNPVAIEWNCTFDIDIL